MLFTHKLLLNISLIAAFGTMQANNWTEFKLDTNHATIALPSYSHMVPALIFSQNNTNQNKKPIVYFENSMALTLEKSKTNVGCLELNSVQFCGLCIVKQPGFLRGPNFPTKFLVAAPTMKCFYFNNELVVFLGNEDGQIYEIAVFEKTIFSNRICDFKQTKSVKIMKLRFGNLDNIDSIAISDSNDCLIIGYTPQEIIGFHHNFVDGAII